MPQHLIQTLGLSPHPEGGFFKETYRSPVSMDVNGRRRSVSTAIYFLLRAQDLSVLHRIASDEVWHFYAGQDLEVVAIDAQGDLRRHRLGADVATGAVPQAVIRAGWWFGSRVLDPSRADAYALVGCTVAPGFEFEDFELGSRAELLKQFPRHADAITAFTRQ